MHNHQQHISRLETEGLGTLARVGAALDCVIEHGIDVIRGFKDAFIEKLGNNPEPKPTAVIFADGLRAAGFEYSTPGQGATVTASDLRRGFVALSPCTGNKERHVDRFVVDLTSSETGPISCLCRIESGGVRISPLPYVHQQLEPGILVPISLNSNDGFEICVGQILCEQLPLKVKGFTAIDNTPRGASYGNDWGRTIEMPFSSGLPAGIPASTIG